MLGLDKKDFRLLLIVLAMVLFAPIILNPFPQGSSMAQMFNAGYPDLMQRFVIFGILVIGFNILFGLTGYLSFGHAAFLGAGSYAAVWMFKLIGYDIIPAILISVIIGGLFSLAVGFVSLRRSGIYFSILTLAMAQMMFNMAYSVLGNPSSGFNLTNGETGLQVYNSDPQILLNPDGANFPNLLGLSMRSEYHLLVGNYDFTFNLGYYLCGAFLLLAFYISIRIFRSPFGMMLRAVKSNQQRLNYTGLNTRPYTLAAFVISGMYAGLAGGLLAAMDPLAGAERMHWTASGEIVIMAILGGVGTLIGPILGAGFNEYFKNILSKINDSVLNAWLDFLPGNAQEGFQWLMIEIIHPFVGKGWHLTLGLLFMLVIIFLPGGLVELGQRLGRLFKRNSNDEGAN